MDIKKLVDRISAVDTPLWRLKYKLLDIFYYAPKSYLDNIWRAIQYAKFGYSNHDFDYNYLLRLIQFKMLRLEEHIRLHDVHTDSKKMSRQIRDLNRILTRIIEDDYLSVETKIALDDRPFWEDCERSESGMRRWKPKKSTKKEDRAWHKEREREERLRKNDLDRFFNGFKEQHKNWWC